MLTTAEKILFALALLATIYLAVRATRQLVLVIARGHGAPDWGLALRRLPQVVLQRTAALEPTFRVRRPISLLHGFVAWSFMFYLLVNLGDVLEGYIAEFAFLGEGVIGGAYRFGADLLSVLALIGMTALLGRRFVLRAPALTVRDHTMLHPKAKAGIRRDSAIVGVFILVHVGARFLGQSLHLAQMGPDTWQPFASALSGLWSGWNQSALTIGRHAAWWLALGAIMVFVPYFPHSKHIHLFFAPINYLLRPERRSIGQVDAIDFEDEAIEQFGAARLEDLPQSALIDAYACIMCNRCQDACPAYATGKVLSPAALEINKRYMLNEVAVALSRGESSPQPLTEFAISPEAVWACTACGACNQVCPVGNEPMHDILEIRRNLVLMEDSYPEALQAAYRGMERAGNPWNVPAEQRLAWADGLPVPTVEARPEPELLWWVGCAPATDSRAQQTARAFAKVLIAAGVDFAVLGQAEMCTGDAARRAGNDYLFFELATANVATLNEVRPNRIVTTCPHCLHTLSNEYPAYGGHYQVIHHTELIQELIEAGRLSLTDNGDVETITFHDPCYLGRQNQIVDAPRRSLVGAGIELVEMPRMGSQSFCCGAGGAQMWKEEESGTERVGEQRLREAEATGAETVATGCPFCMVMLGSTDTDGSMEIRDVAEIVADRLSSSAVQAAADE